MGSGSSKQSKARKLGGKGKVSEEAGKASISYFADRVKGNGADVKMAKAYLSRSVDPILVPILTALAEEQPGDVKEFLVEHLEGRKTNGLVPSRQLSEEEVLRMAGHCMDATVLDSWFQQQINCCQLTACAYALTALGYPTSFDEIAQTVGIDIVSAVGDGMTLAEAQDASVRYLQLKGLPIFCEAYHFDSHTTTPEGWWQAVIENGKTEGDVFALNFHSGIAHGWKSGGGGHFSLLVGASTEDKMVIVADVHPQKYGRYWMTPMAQMYRALNDKDSSGRSRGLLRFGKMGKGIVRPVPTLAQANSIIDWHDPVRRWQSSQQLSKFIPALWDQCLGARNMEAMSCLELALVTLGRKDARLDHIMRALGESYAFHLDNFLDANTVQGIASRAACEIFNDEFTAKLISLASADGEALKSAVEAHGADGSGASLMLVAYDVNVAYGGTVAQKPKSEAGILSHSPKSWGIVASANLESSSDTEGSVVIAAGHSVQNMGRLWASSFSRLTKGMAAVADGGQIAVVVLTQASRST